VFLLAGWWSHGWLAQTRNLAHKLFLHLLDRLWCHIFLVSAYDSLFRAVLVTKLRKTFSGHLLDFLGAYVMRSLRCLNNVHVKVLLILLVSRTFDRADRVNVYRRILVILVHYLGAAYFLVDWLLWGPLLLTLLLYWTLGVVLWSWTRAFPQEVSANFYFLLLKWFECLFGTHLPFRFLRSPVTLDDILDLKLAHRWSTVCFRDNYALL